jgi:hypothetical protein
VCYLYRRIVGMLHNLWRAPSFSLLGLTPSSAHSALSLACSIERYHAGQPRRHRSRTYEHSLEQSPHHALVAGWDDQWLHQARLVHALCFTRMTSPRRRHGQTRGAAWRIGAPWKRRMEETGWTVRWVVRRGQEQERPSRRTWLCTSADHLHVRRYLTEAGRSRAAAIHLRITRV